MPRGCPPARGRDETAARRPSPHRSPRSTFRRRWRAFPMGNARLTFPVAPRASRRCIVARRFVRGLKSRTAPPRTSPSVDPTHGRLAAQDTAASPQSMHRQPSANPDSIIRTVPRRPPIVGSALPSQSDRELPVDALIESVAEVQVETFGLAPLQLRPQRFETVARHIGEVTARHRIVREGEIGVSHCGRSRRV